MFGHVKFYLLSRGISKLCVQFLFVVYWILAATFITVTCAYDLVQVPGTGLCGETNVAVLVLHAKS